jgi:hypothetical protein
VWLLGLSGVLAEFQGSLGTGSRAIYYYAKGHMDFTTHEYHDILPPACIGLCLASITCLAFAVLAYLQPVSPAEPIVKQQHRSGSSSERTPSNPVGFILYGGLQETNKFEEITPAMVHAAVAGAKLFGNSFGKSTGKHAGSSCDCAWFLFAPDAVSSPLFGPPSEVSLWLSHSCLPSACRLHSAATQPDAAASPPKPLQPAIHAC